MAMKASAHRATHGSLWSTCCEPSAAESCSPRALQVDRPPPYALRPSADGPEQSRHSVHATECRDCSGAGVHDLQAHGGGLVLCACADFLVNVDSKVAVARRRRHRAGMRGRRPRGQSSPLWPWLAAAWSPVPRSRRLECAVLGAVQTLSTISNGYVHMTHATRRDCVCPKTRPGGSVLSVFCLSVCPVLLCTLSPCPKPWGYRAQ